VAQRKGKGLGARCGRGGWHLLRVGRLLVRVALAGVQDPAWGAPCLPVQSPPRWLQKPWHWHCSPRQAVEGEEPKHGLKSSPAGCQTLLFPPEGPVRTVAAACITSISHHCHHLAITLPPMFPT